MSNLRRAFVFAGLICATALIAACDGGDVTAPAHRFNGLISRDETPPDTTCRSGYIIMDGRKVCAPT